MQIMSKQKIFNRIEGGELAYNRKVGTGSQNYNI